MNKIKNDLIKIIKRSHNALVLAAALVSFPSYVMIKGRSKNTIQMKGAFIKNSQIRIKGKNNLIKIMPENRLFHCVIHISGIIVRYRLKSIAFFKILSFGLRMTGARL